MRDILTKNEKGLFYAWKIVLFCMSEIMLGNSVSWEIWFRFLKDQGIPRVI